MKKTILAVLSAAMLFSVASPAQAEDQKVLAIIDTAINSDNFPSVIYEACFTASKPSGCSNGNLFMEGKGAGKSPVPASLNSTTYHGDSMVKAALASNPNLKIVFVRVSDVSANGNGAIFAKSLISAIEWVSNNADKHSIDAVSISLSGVSNSVDVANASVKATAFSPNCTNTNVINAVSSLSSKNVPTFAATGNNGSKTVIGFPACIPGVIGVGALSNQTDGADKLGETATNRGPGLDVVSNGAINITKYNGSPMTLSGSSGANVVTASTYLNKNTYATFAEYVEKLSKVSVKFLDYKDPKTNAFVWEPVRLLPISSN
jgi:hypothetical protein